MQALILAAGMGRRLGRVTDDKTKGMIEVNGRTLLERSLDILTSFDEVTRIVIVIGHMGDDVRAAIGDRYRDKEVIYVENPVYDKTNNIYSLFLAEKPFKEEDTILLESDLIYKRSLIERLINNRKDPDIALVSPWEDWMDGTVVTLSENNEITQFISKENFDYQKAHRYYKTVNIYKFSKEFISKIYVPFLDAYCQAFGLNEYYENILGVLALLKKTKLKAAVLERRDRWYEIDDLNDLDIAETLFDKETSSYMNRYGGFWRFPGILDFCFVTNPYFPPERMLEDFKIKLPQLIAQFPSKFSIQRKLAAVIFGCSPDNIILGNGASELISSLLGVLDYQNIGITVPTFYEYVSRADKEKIHLYSPTNSNFSYLADDLILFSKKLDTLVLVNPDNPSGNFIPRDELLRVIDHISKHKKNIIIDETFADFADTGTEQSLIDDELLSKYSNLVVVRSIGKSFGVSGCRLGVLASSDKDLLLSVTEQLPIWNISSFSEYFLQILHRYKAEYKRSVNEIIQQRERLFVAFEETNYLRPIPSSASYILCEVLPPLNCKQFAQSAMERNILIKDCSNKTGMTGRQYIRFSVRNKQDNNSLIEFLKELQ